MTDEKKPKAVPILEGTTGTNLMRGRDVVVTLGGRNLDPMLVDTLAKIAEINHFNMKAIAELANNLDQVIDLVQKFSDIAGNMKERTDQMARAMGEAVEGDEGAGSVN